MRRSRLRDDSEVLGRAAALRALVLAAAGEQESGDAPFSPRERALLAQPSWDEEDARDAVWRGEALGTLRWALRLVEELPPWDESFDHVAVAREQVPADAELRERDEIDELRRQARLWHWRARTALLQAEGRLPLPDGWTSVEQLAAAAAMRGAEDGLLPTPLRGDFPAFGTTYRQLDDEQRALALSIAAERHYALEWLCGTSRWDEVRTDT